MRKIKFRAWDKIDKKMCAVLQITFDAEEGSENNAVAVELFNPLGNGAYLLSEDKVILLQSTGLVDGNRKEVFEGDIVKLNKEWFKQEYWHPAEVFGEYGVIKYANGGFIIYGIDEFYDGGRDRDDVISIIDSFEVIGNIYEADKSMLAVLAGEVIWT